MEKHIKCPRCLLPKTDKEFNSKNHFCTKIFSFGSTYELITALYNTVLMN